MLRNLLATSAALAAFATAAQADFTGPYVGLVLGAGQGNFDVNDFVFDPGDEICSEGCLAIQTGTGYNSDVEGSFFGATIGAMFDAGGFLVGAEAQLLGSDLSFEGSEEFFSAGGEPGFEYDEWIVQMEMDHLIELRARLGAELSPGILGFVSGGLAFARTNIAYEYLEGENWELIGSSEDTRTGFTVGIGASALLENVIVTGEVIYTDLGEVEYVGGTGSEVLTANSDLDFTRFQLSVSIPLGGR